MQRTCRARLFGGAPLGWFVLLGYQFFIVIAATGYLMGITQSKEYAEPEWYADLWLTIVWVAFLVTYLGTVMKREEPHIYVANWFYLAFIITIAMLHIVNNLAMPVSITGTKSYDAWAGVQDAMIQWWYGHNAVGFFLTAAFLGMMYYYIPKAANRPIYSYRLSIVHFWSLVFLYIWAGPHHLHYTSLPDWAQTLGMVFSVMLWMPSWGGMINGLMTLSGAWDKLRTDPGLRFSVTAVGFYGMATFEGPVMSIKAVNSLSHYTDWTIGHVHSGALGWVAFIVFGTIYYLVPKLWNRPGDVVDAADRLALLDRDPRHRPLHHRDVGERHHAGPDVARLRRARLPAVLVRRDGRGDAAVLRDPPAGRPVLPERRPDHGLQHVAHGARRARGRLRRGAPRPSRPRRRAMFIRHETIEKNVILMVVLTLITVSIGGIVQIIPLFTIESTIERVDGVRPYSAARAAGPQHLRPRRLLPLPQPADPAVQGRGRALRPLQPGRREHVRPSVPVGLQAHRARPRARRRQATPTTGTSRISSRRAPWCRKASCRPTRSSPSASWSMTTSPSTSRRCARWARPTPTR